jgi:hypothetical protein
VSISLFANKGLQIQFVKIVYSVMCNVLEMLNYHLYSNSAGTQLCTGRTPPEKIYEKKLRIT